MNEFDMEGLKDEIINKLEELDDPHELAVVADRILSEFAKRVSYLADKRTFLIEEDS